MKFIIETWTRSNNRTRKNLRSRAIYNNMEDALNARASLILISRCKEFLAPRDENCIKRKESNFKIIHDTNYIVSEVIKINN